MIRAEDWMVRDVYTCSPQMNLNEAARMMWDYTCGCLPVVDAHGRVLGMLTDRDVCMGAFFSGRPLREARAGESMSKHVFGCRPTDPIDHVIRLMGDNGVRRVPVVGGDGRVAGLITIDDLFVHLVALDDVEERHRLMTRLVEAMAAVCVRAKGPAEIVPAARPAQAQTQTAGQRATARAR